MVATSRSPVALLNCPKNRDRDQREETRIMEMEKCFPSTF
jgi:hypothetical protein